MTCISLLNSGEPRLKSIPDNVYMTAGGIIQWNYENLLRVGSDNVHTKYLIFGQNLNPVKAGKFRTESVSQIFFLTHTPMDVKLDISQKWSFSVSFLNRHCQPLFIYFRLINPVLLYSWKYIRVAADWIRTPNFWYWKQSLQQLSRNHCPKSQSNKCKQIQSNLSHRCCFRYHKARVHGRHKNRKEDTERKTSYLNSLSLSLSLRHLVSLSHTHIFVFVPSL